MEVHLRTKVWLVNCQLFGGFGQPVWFPSASWQKTSDPYPQTVLVGPRFGDLKFWESIIMNLLVSNPDKMQLVMVISNTHTDYNNNDSFPNKDHNQSASNG